jgi:hypothetical protein
MITDLDVELLRAYAHLYDAQQAHEAAKVRYWATYDQVQAQDREEADHAEPTGL